MKLSIIMQSYLGDYPGARSQPERKFIRAVDSLKNQTDSDWELIIVSDGCTITEEIYNKEFKDDDRIKFKMVEKPKSTMMYEGEATYYRGKPRAEGVKMATGDWISYLDADDIYVKTGVEQIKNAIKKHKDKRYIFNLLIVENLFHLAVIKRMHELYPNRKENHQIMSKAYKIEGLDSYWFDTGINAIPTGTAFLIHKNGWPEHEWGDVTGERSEDIIFAENILTDEEQMKYVGVTTLSYYVRCHYRDRWDY